MADEVENQIYITEGASFNTNVEHFESTSNKFNKTTDARAKIEQYKQSEQIYISISQNYQKITQCFNNFDQTKKAEKNSDYKSYKQQFDHCKLVYQQITRIYDDYVVSSNNTKETTVDQTHKLNKDNLDSADKQGKQIDGMMKTTENIVMASYQIKDNLQAQKITLIEANKDLEDIRKDVNKGRDIMNNISCKDLYQKLAIIILIILLGAADIALIVYKVRKTLNASTTV